MQLYIKISFLLYTFNVLSMAPTPCWYKSHKYSVSRVMNPFSYSAKKSQIHASAIFQIKDTKAMADLLSSTTFGILAPSAGRRWDKFRTGK